MAKDFERIPQIPTPKTTASVEKSEVRESVTKTESEDNRFSKPLPDVQSVPVKNNNKPTPQYAPKSKTLKEIEGIMEKDLGSVFLKMDPNTQAEFKKAGEETATKVEKFLFQVKDHSKQIFKLIFGWLKVIPGVNRYFLEQEAKLKTDELVELKHELQKNRTNVDR